MRKIGLIKETDIHSLNNFAYFVSLPALIATSLWNIDFTNGESLRAIQFSLITILSFSFLLLVILSLTKLSNNLKAAIFLVAATGNTVYMGFPMVELEFGSSSLSLAALIGTTYLIVPLLISIFAIRYWHNKDRSLLKELFEFIKNPLIISVVLGVGLSFIKIDSAIIEGIKKTLSMLGSTASPVALFVLGGFLYGKFLKKDFRLVSLSSILKLIIFPLFIIFVSLFIFGIPDLKVAALLASMPVAVTTFVISEKFRLDSAMVGNAVFVSTVLSFLVVPIIVWFF